MELYAWNTVVSGAFYEPLQGLEIALRNALHGQLTRCYGEAWYDNPEAGLDIGTLERIAKARTDLARVGQVPTPSRVVAELTFGFWVALLRGGCRLDLAGHRADYERTLWRPASCSTSISGHPRQQAAIQQPGSRAAVCLDRIRFERRSGVGVP